MKMPRQRGIGRLGATLFGAFLLSTLISSPARAQASTCTIQNLETCLTDEQATTLSEHLALARAAARERRWAAAIEYLSLAEAIAHLGVTRAAMARAYQEMGAIDVAEQIAREVLNDPDPDARALAAELLQSIEQERAQIASESSGAVVEPVVQPCPACEAPPPLPRRSAILPSVLGGLSAATLVPGVVRGLDSNRLAQQARDYNRDAADASIDALDSLERRASVAARQANTLYVTSALFGGAAIAVLVDRLLDPAGPRRRVAQ